MYDIERLIETNPDILDGAPIFSGTEVSVATLFDYLEAGDSIENFLSAYPAVSRSEVQAVLNIARETILSKAVKVG